MVGICISLGVIFLLYYVFLAVHAGIMVNFGWFWAACGAAFLLAAFCQRDPEKTAVVWMGRILVMILAAGLVLIGIMSASVIGGMETTAPADIRYALVLGAQVRGEKPSRALCQRLDKALALAEESPALTLILSGGQGEGETISEAQCMREYLTEKGLDDRRLILEDRSSTTRENLAFSDELTGCAKKRCGIVTNNFHLFRALKLARKAGYQDVYGIAAPSEPLMLPHYIVREAIALIMGKIRGYY